MLLLRCRWPGFRLSCIWFLSFLIGFKFFPSRDVLILILLLLGLKGFLSLKISYSHSPTLIVVFLFLIILLLSLFGMVSSWLLFSLRCCLLFLLFFLIVFFIIFVFTLLLLFLLFSCRGFRNVNLVWFGSRFVWGWALMWLWADVKLWNVLLLLLDHLNYSNCRSWFLLIVKSLPCATWILDIW